MAPALDFVRAFAFVQLVCYGLVVQLTVVVARDGVVLCRRPVLLPLFSIGRLALAIGQGRWRMLRLAVMEHISFLLASSAC
jgi:hypothetical protein